MDKKKATHAYQNLTPDLILNAVESQGYRCDGRLLALNSYENRVYQVGIEDDKPVIVKFYRPGRWSQEAILEEHCFAWELAEQEIPVMRLLKMLTIIPCTITKLLCSQFIHARVDAGPTWIAKRTGR